MRNNANNHSAIRNRPSISKYAKIVARTVNALVLKDRRMTAVVFCVICTNFAAAYLTIKTTEKFAAISDNFRTEKFNASLRIFLLFSLLTLSLKYLPMAMFNWYCQDMQRKSYILNTREVIELSYVDFHSKTPGDLHYNIFIKSFSSCMTCQVVLLDFMSILGTVFFSTFRVGKAIDKTYAAFFVISPVFYLLTTYFYIKRKMQYHYDLLTREQYAEGKLTDKLLNYEAIKSYGLEKSEIKDFYGIVGQQTSASIRMGNFEAFSKYMISFSTNLPFIFMLVVLLFNETPGGTTGNFLELTLLYLGQAGELRRLGNDLDQLVEFLNQINFSEVQRTDEYMHNNYENHSVTKIPFERNVAWRNVSILYKDKTIISGINLEIKKGEKVAIVGKNGTGKSTFMKSLLGFTKYQGEITVDGANTRTFRRSVLMDLISYIPQDDCTSDDTVLNNILLGLNESDKKNLTRAEQVQKVKEIAQEYNAHDTFRGLDSGYETSVGSRGNRISGGQKQKVSLVRAVLKNAPIFIFDEATAAMDKKYERELIKMILKNLHEKTVLMIVHGKDYLHEFDKIVFLNDGRVEDVDTYSNLLNKNSNFSDLLA